jgi:hypothetical protein
MQTLGQDVRQLGRGRDLNKTHFTILDDFMCEVLPNVNVLGPLTSPDDVVAPLDARGVVLVYRCGPLLSETKSVQEESKVQDLRGSSGC